MFRLRYLFSFILIQSIDGLLSGPNLCFLCCNTTEESIKINSIAFIADERKFFFTSGGHYWIINETDKQPTKTFGLPLPQGFSVGDAAFYLDTSKGCSEKSVKRREIHLIEKTSTDIQVMILDIDSNKWHRNPISYKLDPFISPAKVNWTSLPVNAVFIYKNTNVVIVMKDYYSVVDIKGFCDSDKDLPNAYRRETNEDFVANRVDRHMDAITMINDTFGLIFKEQYFWPFEVKSFNEGKFNKIIKFAKHGVTEDFFKVSSEVDYDTEIEHWLCSHPNGEPPIDLDYIEEPIINSTSSSSTVPYSNNTAEPGGEPGKSDPNDSDDSSSLVWIIVGVVIIVLIVITVGVLSFMVIKRKKSKDRNKKVNPKKDKPRVEPKHSKLKSKV